MIAAAWIALAALLCWLVGVQTLQAGRDHQEWLPRPARASTVTLGAVAALLVVPELHDDQPHPGQDPDLTLLVLVVLTGWLVSVQTRKAGRSRSVRASEAVRTTTALLAAAAALLALPRLWFMVT